MFSNSEQSLCTEGPTAAPPPIPKTRGPLLFEGVRLAGGPPRRTPKRSCSRYFTVTGRAASNGTVENERPQQLVSSVNTPSTQEASPSARMELLGGGGTSNNNVEDDESDIIPSTAPIPTPHPAVLSAETANQHRNVSRWLWFEEGAAEAEGQRSSETSAITGTIMPSTPQGTDMKELPGFDEPSPSPAFPEASGTRAGGACGSRLPVAEEKLRMDFCFLQQDVDTWANPIEMAADTEWHQRHLQETKAAMHSVLHELNLLVAQEAAQHERLCSAKRAAARSPESQAAAVGVGRTGEGHCCQEESGAMEAWRVEKGALLAQKSRLLQEHQQLQYHLRLKLCSGGESQGGEGPSGGMRPPCDRSIAQLRLNISELTSDLKKLEETFKLLSDTCQWRQEEFEDEYGALCRAFATATAGEEEYRVALQDAIREAEGVQVDCFRRGDMSLASLMERGLSEAKAALERGHQEQQRTE